MKNLVGRSFAIADDRYRIVDVQQLGKGAVVYAEAFPGEEAAGAPRRQTPMPPRTAFHYGDIAALLDSTAPI
ncbi:MAG: hypothetical protein ACNA7W_12200 [Pseudomonadales bacterium]